MSNWADSDTLPEKWLHLVDGLLPQAAAEAEWRLLRTQYEEPVRAYHNLEHIGQMLHILQMWPGDEAMPTAVSLAVWYHDAVYDPQASDNEAQSAALLAANLTGLVADEIVQEAVRLVLLTIHHQADEQDVWGRRMIDADLSNFGSARAQFCQNSAAIRREYAHVPEAAYRAGRQLVLQRFLERQPLFLTQWGRQQWETAARQNIQYEIEQLLS